jgi:chromate transporter
MILLLIFLSMLKIGCFAFGGGYAIIALLENEFISKRNWIDHDEFMDVVAIAESTPGPIAINAATFVGYQTRGFVGALAATLGVVLPSFVTIFVIFHILRTFRDVVAVQYAFNGIRVGVLVLLLKALVKLFKTNRKGWLAYCLMGLSFVLTAFGRVNTILVILLCGMTGLVSSLLAERRLGK